MRKTRIAYLITGLHVGGAERNLEMLASALDQERFEVSVGSLTPGGAIGVSLSAKGICVAELGARRSSDVRALPRLLAWLRRVKPDLLHTWLFHANFLGRCAGAILGRCPVVSSIRVAEPRRWHLLLERITAPLARAILVNSASLRDYMIAAGIDAAKLRVIPNAVDLARFARTRRRRKRGGSFDVLFVGRLDRQKGVDVLLRALSVLKVGRTVRVQLVGDGPQREALMRLADELRLTDVTFAGRSDRIPELLGEADVLVLPSRWEGLPNVVLEALAAGCPVIGTDVVGTRDLITDGVNGLLVPSDDPQALARAMTTLAADADLGERLAVCGRDTARRHAIPTMAAAHESLYRNVLGRSRPARA